MTTKQTIKSFTNLELTKPNRLHPREWHGDFGYSSDGIFFTWTTVMGDTDVEVIAKAEKFLGVKFKEEQIKYR